MGDMKIDEEEEIFDESDHNTLIARFRVKRKKQDIRGKKEIEREYFASDKGTIAEFRQKLEKYWEANKTETVTDMSSSMDEIANEILRKTYKKRELNGETK